MFCTSVSWILSTSRIHASPDRAFYNDLRFLVESRTKHRIHHIDFFWRCIPLSKKYWCFWTGVLIEIQNEALYMSEMNVAHYIYMHEAHMTWPNSNPCISRSCFQKRLEISRRVQNKALYTSEINVAHMNEAHMTFLQRFFWHTKILSMGHLIAVSSYSNDSLVLKMIPIHILSNHNDTIC